MAFTERLRAERAFRSIQNADEPDAVEWPATAKRIRDARLKVGVGEGEVADRLGTSIESYYDLETYDDEAFTVVDLRDLVTLGNIFGVEPSVLLLGSEVEHIRRSIDFSDIADGLKRRLATGAVTAEALSEEIGYDIEPVLASAGALLDFNVDGLYNICSALDFDWVAALPNLAAEGE